MKSFTAMKFAAIAAAGALALTACGGSGEQGAAGGGDEPVKIGISQFVSVGNKADVSGNDLIMAWEDDPQTDVITLYLESFGNPVKFSRIARRIGKKKPVIAVKSGRTPASPTPGTSRRRMSRASVVRSLKSTVSCGTTSITAARPSVVISAPRTVLHSITAVS